MAGKTQKKVKAVSQPCPCSIDKFEVMCGHDGRKAGSGGVLEIVATSKVTENKEYIFGAEDSANISVSKKHAHGGKDKITAAIICGDPGCKEKILFGGADLLVNDWKPGKKRTKSLEGESYFKKIKTTPKLSLGGISPKIYTVKGKTSKEEKSITIKQYPSDQISYGLKVDKFGYLMKSVNDAWETWGEAAFGWSPVSVVPKLTAPTGSIRGSYGWKEDKDWKVFYQTTCDAGADPLIGIEIRVEVSLVACAGAAVGVPPTVSKFAGKHLADILVGIGVGVNGKIVGSFSISRYTDGKKKYSGKLVLAIDGYFFIALTARVGSDYVISVAATGDGRITISNENELRFSGEKISFQPSIKLKPIELKIMIRARAFYFFSRKKEKSWKLWKKDIEVWGGKERVLLDIAKLKST